MPVYDKNLSDLLMKLIHFAINALTNPEKLTAEGIIKGFAVNGSLVIIAFGFVFSLGAVSYRPNRMYWNRKLVRVIESNGQGWNFQMNLSPRAI